MRFMILTIPKGYEQKTDEKKREHTKR